MPTLRESRPEAGAITTAIAAAHAAGAKVDWPTFFKGTNAKRVPLPTYPFQRSRYWVDSALRGSADASAIGQSNPEHPLLAAAIEDPSSEGLLLTGRISLSSHPWLAGHKVGGTVLLPGTAFLELALAAAERSGAQLVHELTLEAPLVLAETGAATIHLSVSAPDEDGQRAITIHSRGEGESEWVQNASGALAEGEAAAEPLDSWPPADAEPVDVEYLYDRLAERGLEYGTAFQGLTAAWKDGERIYAAVSLPEEHAHEAAEFGIHPALLDAALHGIGLGAGEDFEIRLPFAWSGVGLVAAGARELRVAITPADGGAVSLALADGAGVPLASVESLALRSVDPAQLQSPSQSARGLLEIDWRETELPTDGGPPAEVELHYCDVEGSGVGAAAARKAAQCALDAVQQLLSAGDGGDSQLAFITRGAMATRAEETPNPATAAIWGLVRSAQSEHPGRFLLIDTDGTEESQEALPVALGLGTAESQLALREGRVLVPRATPAMDTEDSLIPPLGPWRLDALKRGTLESLALAPSARASEALKPSEVRLAVHAAGLNFRDVLVALGLYPGGEAVVGGEGAGVVIEVGPEVDDLAPGDRVLGMIPEAFGPLAISERDVLVPIPEGWSFEQAAALPIVFATALYGLGDLAHLSAGEKVLIHAGAGGVGTAAIQLAQHLGAEVFATASPGKWDVLREAGLDDDHIASSRDLGFKEKFLAVTDGAGVDVVLNALAGEFVDASLALLPRGGRFLEMGKADIRDPQQVGATHEGVAYQPFDLTEAGSVRTGEMLAEIVELLERGSLHHPQIATWDTRQAPQAFRHLREGKNVGKVVLTLPRAIDPERTVLITGGTGGLGTLTARHLVAQHGARHLLLVSRSGADAAGAAMLKAELEGLGAETTVAACDVADRDALEKLLASLPGERPLGAVIHCAGVLADGVVETMGAEQINQVFAPKVDAAWNLHELTAELDLSSFVLFSSAAGTLGGPGQANYAAANVFLDALARRRRGEGLPGISIAWGIWGRESGMASGLSEADRARMRRGGVDALSDERGLALFDAALGADRAQALAVPIDPAGLTAMASAGTLPPILSGLVRVSKRRSTSSGSLVAKLATRPEAEHEDFVIDLVKGEVAAVLGYGSAAEVKDELAFQEMGFDSLAAVELRNRLNSATGLGLGATTVFDYPTPAALAGHLLSAVAGRTRSTGAAGGLEQLDQLLAGIAAADPDRPKLAAHLRSLAAELERESRAEVRPEDVSRLETASDEELLAFIDEQVGTHE